MESALARGGRRYLLLQAVPNSIIYGVTPVLRGPAWLPLPRYRERVSFKPDFPACALAVPHPPLFHPKSQGLREGHHPGSLFLELLDKTKDLSYYCHHTYLLGQRCLLV